MKNIYHYESVSKALDDLSEKGFTYDFNLHEDDISKNPDKYEIVHVYRYEGDSNPDDEAMVFGIKSKSGKKESLLLVLQQIQFLKLHKC